MYDSGDQFKDKAKTINYLAFNSEISLRKGDKGWKINTRFNNRSSQEAIYSHYVTTYKKENNKDWKEESTFYISAYIDNSSTTAGLTIDKGENKYEIQTGKRELNIKIPSESWYKSKDYLFIYRKKVSGGSSYAPREYLNETFKEKKFWSGIWVEDSSDSSSWIFQDIEVFIEDKKYSKFFCKNGTGQTNNCWQNESNSQTRIYKKSDSAPGGEEGTWGYADNAHATQEGSDTTTLSNKVKPIIEKIKDSKGKWVDTDEFCNFAHKRNINESQLKNLQLFCSTKKK